MKSCVVESTANSTSFWRWARLFVVFVAQAVCKQIVLAHKVVSITSRAQLILRACGNVFFVCTSHKIVLCEKFYSERFGKLKVVFAEAQSSNLFYCFPLMRR